MKIVGVGKAPVMEGHRSFIGTPAECRGGDHSARSLTTGVGPAGGRIRHEYRRPAQLLRCRADYAAIASNETMATGLRTPVLGVDVQRAVSKLRSDKAYTFEKKGDCEDFERAMSTASWHNPGSVS